MIRLKWDSVREPAEEQGVVSAGLEVLEHVAQGGPHYAAPICRYAVLGAQSQPRLLEGEQVIAGAIEGDLLFVLGPASAGLQLGGRLGRMLSDL